MKKAKLLITILLTGTAFLCAQAQDDIKIEEKGNSLIVSAKGKKTEIKTDTKTGKKTLAGYYLNSPITRKPDKNKPAEADNIAYIPGVGLAGVSWEKDNSRT